MGALTITLDADQPGTAGEQRRATGTITFSDTYDDTDGDTFDPASMGLATLNSLVLEVATDGTHYLQPELVEDLPLQSHLFSPTVALGHIKALAIPVPPATNIADEASFEPVSSGGAIDLSDYVGRFVAEGF